MCLNVDVSVCSHTVVCVHAYKWTGRVIVKIMGALRMRLSIFHNSIPLAGSRFISLLIAGHCLVKDRSGELLCLSFPPGNLK